MTDLSPAAQAVLDAAINAYWKEAHLGRNSIAAALRAAADQLRKAYANEEYVDHADDWLDAIAAELQGTND